MSEKLVVAVKCGYLWADLWPEATYTFPFCNFLHATSEWSVPTHSHLS